MSDATISFDEIRLKTSALPFVQAFVLVRTTHNNGTLGSQGWEYDWRHKDFDNTSAKAVLDAIDSGAEDPSTWEIQAPGR